MKILVVEDDKTIIAGLSYSLSQEAFEVVTAGTVKEATACIRREAFDLYLLDLILPDGTGYDICSYIKQEQDAPVIFLTACDDEVNVVMGLDMGADDYITKPFRIRELISRIHSVLRRYQKKPSNEGQLQYGDLRVFPNQAKVYQGEQELNLTALEYRLLMLFLEHPRQVLSRSQILEGIWDAGGDFVNDNTLSVYIKRLREKIGESGSVSIRTVRGMGYQLGGEHAEE